MKLDLPSVLGTGTLAVETRNLRRNFGRIVAVDGIDLGVPAGAAYLLVGPNGSGKTTTFRMLMGLLRPTSGSSWVCGQRSGRDGRARARIGFLAEAEATGYGWLRVRDLIDHHARYYPTWDPDYQSRLERLLKIRMDQRFDALSKGQARAVQLVLALAHRPALLLFDEPTDGLDPVARDVVLQTLSAHMSESPTTLLVATHIVSEMEGLADHVGVISGGRLVTQLARDAFQTRLRRYVFAAPESWTPPERLGPVVQRNDSRRERRWIIWGEETDVRGLLYAAGAEVRAVQGLSLQEATVALLTEMESQ